MGVKCLIVFQVGELLLTHSAYPHAWPPYSLGVAHVKPSGPRANRWSSTALSCRETSCRAGKGSTSGGHGPAPYPRAPDLGKLPGPPRRCDPALDHRQSHKGQATIASGDHQTSPHRMALPVCPPTTQLRALLLVFSPIPTQGGLFPLEPQSLFPSSLIPSDTESQARGVMTLGHHPQNRVLTWDAFCAILARASRGNFSHKCQERTPHPTFQNLWRKCLKASYETMNSAPSSPAYKRVGAWQNAREFRENSFLWRGCSECHPPLQGTAAPFLHAHPRSLGGTEESGELLRANTHRVHLGECSAQPWGWAGFVLAQAHSLRARQGLGTLPGACLKVGRSTFKLSSSVGSVCSFYFFLSPSSY